MVDLANADSSRLVGKVAVYTYQKSPYPSVYDKGTIPNVSRTVRSVAIERALPSVSLALPAFRPTEQLCGLSGGTTKVGSTEFEYGLEGLRELGPLICLETTRTAWPSTYGGLVRSLQQSITDVVSADMRANLYVNSGSKMVIASGENFEDIFDGEINAVATPFPNVLPDSTPSFRAMEIAATYMRETLLAMPFSDNGDDFATLIFEQNVIQNFRDELDIREDIRALTTGRYKMGEDTISGYMFKGPYHGLTFGVDSMGLRFNNVDANGQPILLEPLLARDVTVGEAGRPNPAWVSAAYGVGFIVFNGAFARLTPESWKVPGFDFTGPIAQETLKFKQLSDADCNFWGDFGRHMYEIRRAYQPKQPHAVCAVAYKRCAADTNIVACGV